MFRKGNNTLDYSNLKTSEYIKTQTHIELNDTYEDYISLHNDTVSKNDVDTENSLPFDKNSNDKNFVYDEERRSFVLTKDLSYILPITNTGTISLNAKRKNVTTTKDTILSLSGKIELKCDNTKLYLSSTDSNANATYELSNTWNNIILSYSKLVASSSIDTYPYSVKVYVDGALLINTTLQLKYDITSNIAMRLSSAFNYEGIKYSESILDDDCNSRCDVISKYNTSGSVFSKIINADYQIRLTSDYIYDDKNRLIQEQTFIGNNEININYEYDESNRLKTIARTENNVVQDQLEVIYDVLGRLLSTTHNGVTNTYSYDKLGNITLIHNKMAFEYDNYNRLTKYGSYNVYYPTSGDILYPNKFETSLGEVNLLWTNKKLTRYTNENNISTTFSYNEDGQRIIKTSNGTRYDYNYDINGRLISERRTINNVVTTYLYYYDESDRLIGYSRNNEMFFYLRDAQGVIYAIINSVGNIVARYTYDAYGKVLTSNGTEANNNFIRYKGYYYDVETGLAMVGQRYYSPELCRFIQPADVSALNPSSINGLNLYSYANNNPIGTAYKSSSVGVSVANRLINQNFSLLMVPNLGINKNNYSSSVHWKNEWLVTSWPSFLVFSNEKAALLDWGLSIYKGSLYFDEAENHSIYIGVGNVTAFAGYDVEQEKIGFFADVYLFNVGYDGRYIDVGISFVGMGFIFGIEDKKLKIKLDLPGIPGIEFSIDFGQIIKDIFGWEW